MENDAVALGFIVGDQLFLSPLTLSWPRSFFSKITSSPGKIELIGLKIVE
jgi:hypothetical protein